MLNSITSPLDGIRSPFGAIRNPFAAYAIGGQTPQTIADFEADKYASANKNLGPELVTNGTFDTDSDWLFSFDWGISGGQASSNGTTSSNIYQTGVTETGNLYQVSVDVLQNDGSCTLRTNTSATVIGDVITTTGTFTFVFVAVGDRIDFRSGFNTADVIIDNFSVREVVSYSPASTTAESLLTHTRAGTATYTDSTGTLQTAASGVLRKDNHIWDGSSWVKRCLVEPQSTNLITYSQDFTDASWLAAGFLDTPSSPSETGPDGQTSATQIIDDNSTGTGICYLRQDVTVSTSTTYTFSAFLKADQLAHALIYLSGFTTPANDGYFIDLSDGTTSAYSAGTGTTPNVESVGNGWYRFAITFTTDATDTAGQIRIYVSSGDTAGDQEVDLDGTSSILIYGAQLEASSVPTSYIPTAGSQVTRPADALSIDSTLLPYDSTAMTIALDGEMTYADTDAIGNPTFFYWGATSTANERIRVLMDTRSTDTGQVIFEQVIGGSPISVSSSGSAYSPDLNVPFNIASRHTSSDLNGAVDGTALTANTTPTTLPDLSATDFQIAPTGVINIKSLRILGGYGATDAELEAATT